jgi:hypothetical protein
MGAVHDLSEWVYSNMILNVIIDLPRIEVENGYGWIGHREDVKHPNDFKLLKQLAIKEIDSKSLLYQVQLVLSHCIQLSTAPKDRYKLSPHISNFNLTHTPHFPIGRTFKWDSLGILSRSFEQVDYCIHLVQQNKDNNLYLCFINGNKFPDDDTNPTTVKSLDQLATDMIYCSIDGKNSIGIRYRLRVQDNVSVYREVMSNRFHFEQIN